MPFTELLNICVERKIEIVGLTPWLKNKYQDFIDALRNYDHPYPKEIRLYHLN